eukprot:12934001-Prorocentrum_lima.AAC.1
MPAISVDGLLAACKKFPKHTALGVDDFQFALAVCTPMFVHGCTSGKTRAATLPDQWSTMV